MTTAAAMRGTVMQISTDDDLWVDVASIQPVIMDEIPIEDYPPLPPLVSRILRKLDAALDDDGGFREVGGWMCAALDAGLISEDDCAMPLRQMMQAR
jgi:hypothetical protein